MQSSLFSPEKRLHQEVEMGILFFPMEDHLNFFRICILNWIALSGYVGFITRKGRSVLGCSLHRLACSVEWCRIERSISGMWSSTQNARAGTFVRVSKWFYPALCILECWPEFFSATSFSSFFFFFFNSLLFRAFWGNLLPAFPLLFSSAKPVESGTINWMAASVF